MKTCCGLLVRASTAFTKHVKAGATARGARTGGLTHTEAAIAT